MSLSACRLGSRARKRGLDLDTVLHAHRQRSSSLNTRRARSWFLLLVDKKCIPRRAGAPQLMHTLFCVLARPLWVNARLRTLRIRCPQPRHAARTQCMHICMPPLLASSPGTLAHPASCVHPARLTAAGGLLLCTEDGIRCCRGARACRMRMLLVWYADCACRRPQRARAPACANLQKVRCPTAALAAARLQRVLLALRAKQPQMADGHCPVLD
jgi:hypothetical protein